MHVPLATSSAPPSTSSHSSGPTATSAGFMPYQRMEDPFQGHPGENAPQGFYGISGLPSHFSKTSPQHSFIQTLPDPSTPRYVIPASQPHIESESMGIRPPVVHNSQQPLPVGAYLSSAARQHPTNFTNQTVPPAPQTIYGAILPTDTLSETQDHLKRVKDYQLQLLRKHEQSKKVLADTRAEIEKRRKELLERYPTLELKSPADGIASSSVHENEPNIEQLETGSGSSHGFQINGHISEVAPAFHAQEASLPSQHSSEESNKVTDEASQNSPSKSAISNLLTRLASHPYYVSRLSQPEERQRLEATGLFPKDILSAIAVNGSLPPTSGMHSIEQQVPVSVFSQPAPSQPVTQQEKIDRIRKSLPFDESLQESPITAVQQHGLNITEERSLMDESVLSSSTDRGSPQLPGRRSAKSSDSEPDTSIVRLAKSRNELFEKRQADLRLQLEEIQKQKEEILSRHQSGQMRLVEEQELLKNKLTRAQQQIEQSDMMDADDEVTTHRTNEGNII